LGSRLLLGGGADLEEFDDYVLGRSRTIVKIQIIMVDACLDEVALVVLLLV